MLIDSSVRITGLLGESAAASFFLLSIKITYVSGDYVILLVRYLKLDPRVDALLTAANCQAVSLLPDPPSIGTFGLLMRVEDGMWVVSIGGYEGVHPPKDDAQLLEWGKQV